MISRRLLLPLLVVSVSALARAQEGRPCVLEFRGLARGADPTKMNVFTSATGGRDTFVGGGVEWSCAGQDNRLRADSAEHYSDRGELILIRRVHYTEPRMVLDSDRMIYYTGEERLLATGNVRGRTDNGTRFSGPQMEYFRAKPGLRAFPSWRAPGRPTVRMAPATATVERLTLPAGDTRGDSTDLTADFIVSENDSLVWAVGKVVIERHDLRATADSASMDDARGYSRLRRTPVIVGTGERPYTLHGTEIDLWSRDQRLERVRSAGSARVNSDSLVLVGDTIDIRMSAQRMERVFAWGSRARATTTGQEMEADSLDVILPGQRLREVRAVGKAVAWSAVDTSRITSEDRDWIAGDSLVASFDSLATADTTEATRMREIVATGSARSFYQLAGSATERGLPTISYNRGRVISVHFEDGAVATVAVRDKASGVFLEPVPVDTTRPPAVTPPRRP